MKNKIKRGDVYYAILDPVVGSEQGGERPVLVIQNNKGNQFSPTVIVVAITSKYNKRRELPTHIPIKCKNLPLDSIALAEHIRTLDKTRLFRYVGYVEDSDMRDIDNAIKLSMGVI